MDKLKNTSHTSIEKLSEQEDGVKYFRDKLRPVLSKEATVFSSGDFTYFFEQGGETLNWSPELANLICF